MCRSQITHKSGFICIGIILIIDTDQIDLLMNQQKFNFCKYISSFSSWQCYRTLKKPFKFFFSIAVSIICQYIHMSNRFIFFLCTMKRNTHFSMLSLFLFNIDPIHKWSVITHSDNDFFGFLFNTNWFKLLTSFQSQTFWFT